MGTRSTFRICIGSCSLSRRMSHDSRSRVQHNASSGLHIPYEDRHQQLTDFGPRQNPSVHCQPFSFHISSTNAIDLFEKFDIILDCTDQPATRYLISDAAVIAGRRLVSASALKSEGQLMVLNNPPSCSGKLPMYVGLSPFQHKLRNS